MSGDPAHYGGESNAHDLAASPDLDASTTVYDMPLESMRRELSSISVSPDFPPSVNGSKDLVFVSSDAVFFYTSTALVLRELAHGIPGVRAGEPAVAIAGLTPHSTLQLSVLPEPSDVVAIVLHTLHGDACTHAGASDAALVHAVNALAAYGASLRTHIAPGTPLYTALLARAQGAPLLIYALAGRHDLAALATPVSGLLLRNGVEDIADEYAALMTPRYLRRLVMLRIGRMERLKALLLRPPETHAPAPWCDPEEQETMLRSWALTAAHFVMERGPEVTTISLEVMFTAIRKEIKCPVCLNALATRTNELVTAWGEVKRTI